MRKLAAAVVAAGVMALGVAVAPAQAQASDDAMREACYSVGIVLRDFAAVEVAGPGSARDGLFNRADLHAAAQGANGTSPVLQQAAYRVGADLELFATVDRWYVEPRDRLISEQDLRGFKLSPYCFG